MNLQENISLQPFNTFGLAVKARYFIEATSVEMLQQILADPQFTKMNKLILGGGSNLLFTRDFDGLVIKNNIRGIEKIKETEEHVWIKSGAGENWHQLVLHAINQSYGGLENLSLIPGTVGAAPMQNIGAYGVEIKDHFESLEAMNMQNGSLEIFDKDACQFAYRHSIFKDELKGKYIITSVTFKLDKQPHFRTTYGAIQETLDKFGVTAPTLKAISDAVINIRQSKLPDPTIIGNAGSFFKNPSIVKEQFDNLKKQFSHIPGYDQPDDTVKVPAGWLIEQCGWKGKTIGNVGVHENQALVLVNRGGAQGEELRSLASDIQASVANKFGIELVPEVNVV